VRGEQTVVGGSRTRSEKDRDPSDGDGLDDAVVNRLSLRIRRAHSLPSVRPLGLPRRLTGLEKGREGREILLSKTTDEGGISLWPSSLTSCGGNQGRDEKVVEGVLGEAPKMV